MTKRVDIMSICPRHVSVCIHKQALQTSFVKHFLFSSFVSFLHTIIMVHSFGSHLCEGQRVTRVATGHREGNFLSRYKMHSILIEFIL